MRVLVNTRGQTAPTGLLLGRGQAHLWPQEGEAGRDSDSPGLAELTGRTEMKPCGSKAQEQREAKEIPKVRESTKSKKNEETGE